MTQDEQLAELDAATHSIQVVRDAIAKTNTDRAIALIDAALGNLDRSIEATTAAQQELEDAKAALQGTEPPEPPPSGYNATTDRDVRPLPSPPTLGAAGFHFTDPSFGTALVRVTDEHTGGGSIRVPSNSHISAWNCDSTKFFAMNEGGGTVFFSLNGGNPARLQAECGSYIEPAFSYNHPTRVWCAGGSNQRTIYTYDIETGDSTVICDLDRQYPELALTGYIGCTLTTDGDVWVTFFGGGSQDTHRYIHHSKAGLLDVTTRLGFFIHAIAIDRPGRYVMIYSTAPDIQAGKPQTTIWDTETGVITAVTQLPGGHGTQGYGVLINQDCCTQTEWDGCQWQWRELANPNVTKDLIVPTLVPHEIYISDHANWRNNTGQNTEPFFSFTYRRNVEGQPVAPWRAWDDEIIAVMPDGSSTVYRFAHHQSDCTQDFWSEPIGNVSPDGRWAIFTSNWQRMLANQRQDVFLVQLL